MATRPKQLERFSVKKKDDATGSALTTALSQGDRVTSDQRYHTERWRKLRISTLKACPCCAMCAENRIFRNSFIADHIVPASLKLTDFYEPKNLWGLCERCHSQKRVLEQQAYRAGTAPLEALALLTRAAQHMPALYTALDMALRFCQKGKEWPRALYSPTYNVME